MVTLRRMSLGMLFSFWHRIKENAYENELHWVGIYYGFAHTAITATELRHMIVAPIERNMISVSAWPVRKLLVEARQQRCRSGANEYRPFVVNTNKIFVASHFASQRSASMQHMFIAEQRHLILICRWNQLHDFFPVVFSKISEASLSSRKQFSTAVDDRRGSGSALA